MAQEMKTQRSNVQVLELRGGEAVQHGVDATHYSSAVSRVTGTVTRVYGTAFAVTDSVSVAMIENTDLAAGAGDILSADIAFASATEGAVIEGALHGTAANLVVNNGDVFELTLTTDGTGKIDGLVVYVEIDGDEPSEALNSISN